MGEACTETKQSSLQSSNVCYGSSINHWFAAGAFRGQRLNVCHAQSLWHFPRVLCELANLSPLHASLGLDDPCSSWYGACWRVNADSLQHQRHSAIETRLQGARCRVGYSFKLHLSSNRGLANVDTTVPLGVATGNRKLRKPSCSASFRWKRFCVDNRSNLTLHS